MRREQEIIVNRINELCMERNMTYYALASKSGVSLTTLMHIIDGTSGNPGVFTMKKLCKGLGISLKEFFHAEECKELLKVVEE